VLLQAEGLKYQNQLDGVLIEVRHEIVTCGFARLVEGTARALFGAETAYGGTVKLEGSLLSLRGPHDAIDGMAFLSEDRKADGIIPELSVRENLTLAALPAPRNGASFPGNDRASSSTVSCSVLASRRRRRAEDPRTLGGNQQKVLLARWLCKNTKLLLSSTSRLAVSTLAKGEIQRLIAELAEQARVLMISSEMEELVEGSQRVVVLRDGRSVAELSGEQKNTNSARHGGRCRS